MKLIYIGLFGLLGVFARYFFGSFVVKYLAPPFPYGTFIVNLTGAFFTAQPNAFGIVTVAFPSPYSPGVKDTVQMNQMDFQATLILHELGHETGVFGPDTTDTVNGGYTDQVLENCFGMSLP